MSENYPGFVLVGLGLFFGGVVTLLKVNWLLGLRVRDRATTPESEIGKYGGFALMVVGALAAVIGVVGMLTT